MTEPQTTMDRRKHWQLNPSIDFLNHGSFGATPTCVLEVQRQLRDALECDPIRFLAPERDLLPRLDAVRARIAQLVNGNAADIAWVRNATDGVNAVVRSFPFAPGDNVVVTDHGYNACNNAVRYAAERAGATVRVAELPFPVSSPDEVVDAIQRMIDPSTRLLLIDHVTSPTGLVLPVAEIAEVAHAQGVRVLVDAAHAAGMVDIDLQQLGVDYYTANHHKWICAPKSSGFLWVKPDWQQEVRPTVISHAANRPIDGRSRFISEFDWTGTFDPTPLLSVPAAIDFLDALFPGGLTELMRSNHRLAILSRDRLCTALAIDPPAPDRMLGSLVALPLPASDAPLQQILRDRHGFEFPIYPGIRPGTRLMRVSLQAYNDLDQITRLADLLPKLLV